MQALLSSVLAVLLLADVASAQAARDGSLVPARSPRNASYAIDATLDAGGRTLTATEIITWRNITSRSIDDLQFHLYWNAWRDNRSTWMREAALAGTVFRNRRDTERGSIDVTAVELLDASDAPVSLTSAVRFIAPDDGNRDDRTVMSVPLPQPVGPGGTVRVRVAWTAHVPRAFARTGAIGDFFFVAQWFPKVGVLLEDGWNCHQFHLGTEFFSDFGVYDVRLTVPAGWVVGATGVERDRRDNADGTTTHHYYQEDVHDFAWTTSPDYVERTERFEHEGLPPVEMRLLLQPEHLPQASRHFDATRAALTRYGEWFGPYPYGHLTIVDPAYQSGADGMEYPTLFTAGSRWIVPADVTTPESVTVHEAGHQFFYGVVATNEFEDAWMDEGINTFATARVIAEDYPANYLSTRFFGDFLPFVFRDIPLARETIGNRLSQYRVYARAENSATPAYRYFPSRASNTAISYAKTALWLNTLERRMGWPSLQRVLAAYFTQWSFKHPRPGDFFKVVTDEVGSDFDAFFDESFRSSNVFDYGIADLETAPEGDEFRTSVVVRRYGEGLFPVVVRVTFANGDTVNEEWHGRDRWKAYTYDRPSRAVSAEVDPDRHLLLDVNTVNNSKSLSPRGPQASTKWSLTWLVWLQDLLLSWAFFV